MIPYLIINMILKMNLQLIKYSILQKKIYIYENYNSIIIIFDNKILNKMNINF